MRSRRWVSHCESPGKPGSRSGPSPYHLEDAIKVKASKTKSGANGSVAPAPRLGSLEGRAARACTRASSSTAAAIPPPGRRPDQPSTSASRRPSTPPSGCCATGIARVALVSFEAGMFTYLSAQPLDRHAHLSASACPRASPCRRSSTSSSHPMARPMPTRVTSGSTGSASSSTAGRTPTTARWRSSRSSVPRSAASAGHGATSRSATACSRAGTTTRTTKTGTHRRSADALIQYQPT